MGLNLGSFINIGKKTCKSFQHDRIENKLTDIFFVLIAIIMFLMENLRLSSSNRIYTVFAKIRTMTHHIFTIHVT